MPEIELGAFIALNIIAASGWFLTAKWGWGVMLILSFIIFGGLSLYMFANLEVVQTKRIPPVSANSTIYDNGGNILQTKEATVPGYDEKNVVIATDQENIGWVYFFMAGLSITWFVKIILGMFKRRNTVNAAGYYSS